MKKKIAIIIIAVIILAAGIFCLIYFGQGLNKTDDSAILGISTQNELNKFIEDNKVEMYSISKDVSYVGNMNIFSKVAEVEFFFSEDSVAEMNVYYTLYPFEFEEPEEGEENDAPEISDFTDKEKEKINNAFENIKQGFEEYMGCTFESYDKLPTHETEKLEDTDESFYAGDFIKEYSVRDKYGCLWIMRYEASMGSASVVISKLADETGFEGFLPIIDLTKN